MEAKYGLAVIPQAVLENKMFEKMVIYMYIAPRQGKKIRWVNFLYEPRHEKTDLLHMRKQRRRSASQ